MLGGRRMGTYKCIVIFKSGVKETFLFEVEPEELGIVYENIKKQYLEKTNSFLKFRNCIIRISDTSMVDIQEG